MEKLIEALQEIQRQQSCCTARKNGGLSGGHDGPGTGAPCPCLRGIAGAGKAASSGGVQ